MPLFGGSAQINLALPPFPSPARAPPAPPPRPFLSTPCSTYRFLLYGSLGSIVTIVFFRLTHEIQLLWSANLPIDNCLCRTLAFCWRWKQIWTENIIWCRYKWTCIFTANYYLCCAVWLFISMTLEQLTFILLILNFSWLFIIKLAYLRDQLIYLILTNRSLCFDSYK